MILNMNMEEVIIEADKQMQATNRLKNKIIKQTHFNEDLPRQKMMALVDLKFLGKSKLKDIAEEVSESRQTLCMMYNSLEKDGYVKREIDDKDRRNTFYSITKKGDDLLEERKKIIMKILTDLLKELSEEDLQKFGEALKTINKITEEYF